VKVIVRSLEAAGFKATLLSVPTYEDLEKLNADPHAPVNLQIGGWCTDWPSGGSWFEPLFHSDGWHNWTDFEEPAVDAEIERIRQLPIEEQPAAWGALDKTIMTEYYPAIVNFYQAGPILHGSGIGGINADDIYQRPTWKDLYVMQ